MSTVELEGLIGSLVGWLTRSLTKRYMAMEGEGLKARSEAQAASASERSAAQSI